MSQWSVDSCGELRKQMENAEMLADVKAYDSTKARLEDGEDELIPLEITERRLRALRHPKSAFFRNL